MSALPNSTNMTLAVDGRLLQMSDFDAASLARDLNNQFNGLEAQQVMVRLKLGSLLRQVRDRRPHGTWEAWLGVTGIDPRRARSAMQFAGALAGEDGKPDPDKCLELKLITQEEAEHLRRHGADMPERITLRQAEIAAGIRKAAPVAPVEKPAEPDDSLEEIPCAGPEEIAALNRMYGITDEEDGVDGSVDVQGTGTVTPAAAPADKPPVARDQAVAGRIGPARIELGRARRPEAAGQMTLAPLFDDVYLDVQRMDQAGRGEKARAIVAEGLADIRRKLAELGEAA